MDRRTVLSAAGSLGAVAVGGCLADGDVPAEVGDGDDGGAGPGDGVVEASIETVETDCGSLDSDRVAVERADDGRGIVLTGRLPSNTPCYEAVLADYGFADGTLSVTVDVEPDGSEGCVDCEGEVRYRAVVELADATAVERIVVDHATGEEHDPLNEDPDDGGEDPVTDATVETTGSDCAGPDADRAEVAFGDPIAIEGTLPAPNPCHEAVLAGTALADGRLVVGIDAESTLGEGEACQECEGTVRYEARIEVAEGASVERVVVDHATGEDHERAADGESGGDDGANDDETGDDGTGATPEIVETGIETTATDCASGDVGGHDAEWTDEAIVVTGRRSAPTPCHDAALADAAVDGATLSLTVGLDPRDEICVECIGVVEYEARIGLTDANAIETVEVEHADAGERAVGPGVV